MGGSCSGISPCWTYRSLSFRLEASTGVPATHRCHPLRRRFADLSHHLGPELRRSLPDLITYYTTFVGILRSGCTPFAISPRNSPAAIAHLLSKTGTKNVLLGREPAFQHLSGAAFKILESQGHTPPKTALLPTFEELYVPNSEENFEPLPPPTATLDDIAHMFHSSGREFDLVTRKGIHPRVSRL